MREFFKRHGYDTALAVVVLLFGASIIGLFNDVLAALSAYPMAVAACCGLSLVVGLSLSALGDRKAVMVAKVHEDGETERLKLIQESERAAQETEAEERARSAIKAKEEETQARLDAWEERFRSEESAQKKAIAVALYRMEEHYVLVDEYRVHDIEQIADRYMYGSCNVFYEFENIGESVAKMYLVDGLIELFDARPDVEASLVPSAVFGAGDLLRSLYPASL